MDNMFLVQYEPLTTRIGRVLSLAFEPKPTQKMIENFYDEVNASDFYHNSIVLVVKAKSMDEVREQVIGTFNVYIKVMENNIMEYKRGCRACLNLIRDPVDNYIEHKDEIEEVLKPFTVVPRNKISKVDTDQWLYISSAWQDKNYVRAVEICKGSKIYSTDENDLYELDKELNELGFKTRMGRNCDTGTLSIAVLEEPETENK